MHHILGKPSGKDSSSLRDCPATPSQLLSHSAPALKGGAHQRFLVEQLTSSRLQVVTQHPYPQDHDKLLAQSLPNYHHLWLQKPVLVGTSVVRTPFSGCV